MINESRIRIARHDRKRYMAVVVPRAVAISKLSKMMFAENEFHIGKSVWKFELGAWHCKKADDCLKFLLKKDVAAAKLDLIRRGFTWRWI